MLGQVNSNRVVKFNATTANILEDSDENESDVESDVRSYARLGNQPVIIRPRSLVILN